MKDKIQLGDKVKCIYTGFTGIAVARTEYINGCIQFSVCPKWDGKSLMIEETQFDESSLKIISKKLRKKEEPEDEEEKEEDGGATRRAVKMRGY